MHIGPDFCTVRPSARARAARLAVLLGVVVVTSLLGATPALARGSDRQEPDQNAALVTATAGVATPSLLPVAPAGSVEAGVTLVVPGAADLAAADTLMPAAPPPAPPAAGVSSASVSAAAPAPAAVPAVAPPPPAPPDAAAAPAPAAAPPDAGGAGPPPAPPDTAPASTPPPAPAAGQPGEQRAAPVTPVAERSFTALLLLLAAVLVFLAVHGRLDRRDPKWAGLPGEFRRFP